MESDPQLKKHMQQARGLFIIPKYARAGLGVAGRGGAGIALMKQGNNWSDPVFYNIGGLSAGLQGGVEAGPIAFILNNEKAVQGFHQNNNFSLNADSGLTVINWNAKAAASAGQGDVIAWSGTKGLFGNVAVGITDIKFDKDETAALYGKQVAAADIFSGKIKASSQQVADLKKALPSPTLSGGASSQSPSNESQPNQ